MLGKTKDVRLLLAVILIAGLIILTSCSSQDSSSPEDRIAELSESMAEKPRAATAQKMLDLAIDTEKNMLVLSVLRDIQPWAEVEDVAEVFIQGSKWYIPRVSLGDAVFWLEEEILKLDSDADLNQALAESYKKSGLRYAEQYADRLFQRWDLDEEARERYLTIYKAKVVWTAPLPLNGDHSPTIPDFPVRLANRQEYSDILSYVELWKACWELKLDQERLSMLESLNPEDDPLGLYWPVWATFLVQGLEDGWKNPLGLDVEARIPEVIANLDKDKKEAVLNVLYAKRDPGSAPHSQVILDVLASQDFGWQWGEQVPDLVSAVVPDLDIDVAIVYLEPPTVEIPKGYEGLFERLHGLYGIFDGLQVLKNVKVPESELELKRSLQFETLTGISFSPVAPVALIDGDSGQFLLDFSTWKLTEFPGCWGSWSPRGDKFALLKAGDPESEILILSAEGVELERHSIPVALEREEGSALTFIPRVTWESPFVLEISRHLLRGEMYGFGFSPYYYDFDLRTKTLTESAWRSSVSHITGTDLFYISKSLYDEEEPLEEKLLMDGDGNTVGEVLVVEYQDGLKKVSLPNNAQLLIEDYSLVFKNPEGEKANLMEQWEAHSILWAVMNEGKVYAEVYFSIPQRKGGGFQAQVVIDPDSGKASILRNDLTWYEEISFTCISQQTMTDISALFFAGNWFYPFRTETVSADGIPLPVAVTSYFRVFKYKDSYILMAAESDTLGGVDGEAVILVFE